MKIRIKEDNGKLKYRSEMFLYIYFLFVMSHPSLMDVTREGMNRE